EARRRAFGGRRALDLVEEPAHPHVGRPLLVEPLERVEQVAAPELRPQLHEGLRPRDPVEAELVAERENSAALTGLEGERGLELLEPAAVRGERVGVRM